MTEEKPQPTIESGVKVTSIKNEEGSLRDVMGPFLADKSIRQAILHCWMILPEADRSAERLEQEILRLVQRALKDAKEDLATFGTLEAGQAKHSPGSETEES